MRRAGQERRADAVAASPRAASTWGWVRKRQRLRSAPRTSAARRSAPSRSAVPQVGAAQVGADQVGAAQARAPQVARAGGRGPSGRRPGGPAPPGAAHELADPRQQVADLAAVGADVEGRELLRRCRRSSRSVPLAAPPRSRRAAARPPAAPAASVRYQSISCSCRMTGRTANCAAASSGRLPPGPPAEGDLGDLLAGAEAVEDRAAGEPAVAQLAWMPQRKSSRRFGHGRPGGLVDREVGRRGERRRDAAEAGAARAVGPQVRPPRRRVGSGRRGMARPG